ncbi:MAG: GNAT family N-acetyltransferase [Actinobacteria bacterium]|nr:GNAT family N-acetyltransferase [Actinomycetota bacterium]|tara:strand:- start:51 stop:470 length:420 start_codon:yes stop_codon:yes gene_type:complete
MIQYKINQDIQASIIQDLYLNAGVENRRPTDGVRLEKMITNANLMVSAWDDDLLIGVCRCMSDFTYVTYVADLMVRETYQKRGVGRELLRITKSESGDTCKLVLVSAPDANDFYSRVGFSEHPRAWELAPNRSIQSSLQ